jgi:acetyltransferase-like isoleucine patch superfamily enzyme
MAFLFEQTIFVVRVRYYRRLISFVNKLWYRSLGMKIGSNTLIQRLSVSWPHQVSIGTECNFETNIVFKFDGIWKPGPAILIGNCVFLGTGVEFNIRKGISIGDHSLIASGCRFIDHDHGFAANTLVHKQKGEEKKIIIQDDVWLGCNVVILKGVEIGKGAIVAAGAVVTKSIPADEIWGGVPAKKISVRL